MDARVEQWRADTPGCAARVHLNNAGAALMPRPVHEALQAHLALEAELGGYEAADARAPLYPQAELTVETSARSCEAIVDQLRGALTVG